MTNGELLLERIEDFIDWLLANTDFRNWHPDVRNEVHVKLIQSILPEREN